MNIELSIRNTEKFLTSRQCMDSSGFLICQAYLTQLQAALHPNALLHSLFSPPSLSILLDLCTLAARNQVSQLYYHQDIAIGLLLEYFPQPKPTPSFQSGMPIQSTIPALIEAIRISLGQWSAIRTKANILGNKINHYHTSISACHHQACFLTTAESQDGGASMEEGESQSASCGQAPRLEVISFLEWASRWMDELLGQINHFKGTIKLLSKSVGGKQGQPRGRMAFEISQKEQDQSGSRATSETSQRRGERLRGLDLGEGCGRCEIF